MYTGWPKSNYQKIVLNRIKGLLDTNWGLRSG